MDALRVDMLDDAGKTYETRGFIAPDVADWPVSFGIALQGDRRSVRFRARAFRTIYAAVAKVNGVDVLDPNPDVTVDRVVDLTLPDDGIRIVRVLLSMGCMGTRSSFGPDGTTCVGAGHRAGLPSEGTTDLKALPTTSSVAKWSRAAERPCAGAVNVERPCEPDVQPWRSEG